MLKAKRCRTQNISAPGRPARGDSTSGSNDSLQLRARLDEERAERREIDEAGCRAFGLRDELALRVVDRDLRVAPGLAEVRGELRGLDDCPVRHLPVATARADDDVRAGVVRRVHPSVERARDAEGQLVVLTRAATDEDFVAVRRAIPPDAAQILGGLLLVLFCPRGLRRRPALLRTRERGERVGV